jgi:5-methylcytosine-specific restriction endonuclease McrA
MQEFYEKTPTLDNYWRHIVLFGANSASYKFALAKSLIGFQARGNDLIRLDELAVPFSKYICEHLQQSTVQGTAQSSKFLEACKSYLSEDIDQTKLIESTTRLGFVNVIDAFHHVDQTEVPERFFLDERKESGGIRLTQNLFKLLETVQAPSLYPEVEARWRLVERAWDLGIAENLVVSYDRETQRLFTTSKGKRVDVTSSREALNGYQKGLCFYCFRPISISSGDDTLADVDHFFPHKLKRWGVASPINGIWNLVLACSDCNRGKDGKFDLLPEMIPLLKRLEKRNNFFAGSHHPLRETIISQTGTGVGPRHDFLQSVFSDASEHILGKWLPEAQGPEAF